MSELTTKLGQILTIKQSIGTNIVAKGSTVSNFESYPSGVQNIPTGEQRPQRKIVIFTKESTDYETFDTSWDSDQHTQYETSASYSYTIGDEISYMDYAKKDFDGEPGQENYDYYTINEQQYDNYTESQALSVWFNGKNLLYTQNTGTNLINEILTLQQNYNITEYIEGSISETNTTIYKMPEEPSYEITIYIDGEPYAASANETTVSDLGFERLWSIDGSYWMESDDTFATDGENFSSTEPIGLEYLKFSVPSDYSSSCDVTYSSTAQPSAIYYKIDEGEWSEFGIGTTATVNVGETMYLKGSSTYTTPTTSCYHSFAFSGDIALSGNPASLYYDDIETYVSSSAPSIPNDACYKMFADNTVGIDASELFMNNTFENANYAYSNMFNGCSGLTDAPELKATTLGNFCYHSMFMNCTSLTTAPELPATTLKNGCYNSMFKGCTSLTTAPELKAITLAGTCYKSMFDGCSNLNYVKCIADTAPTGTQSTAWLQGVSASGTFVKSPNATWGTGPNAIPEGWTVEDAWNND